MPKLLLVDDNELNCDMLSRRLTRKGYEVSVAHDGLSGIAMAQGNHPDIILMDLTLPLMDGTDATKRLKTDDATRDIPVIALTAHAMEGDRNLALGAGFDDYDTKPVDLTRLLGKIGALLSRGANLNGELPPTD
jgi:CheY-like chemotaxis protein